MEKYYTPEIEEFHHGFEFCFVGNERLREYKAGQSWDLFSEGTDHLLVKYLDKEDIESLGYKKDDFSFWEGMECFSKDHNKIYLDEEENYVIISKLVKSSTIIPSIGKHHYYSTDVFKGTIKNKSELKKLMKQLGI